MLRVMHPGTAYDIRVGTVQWAAGHRDIEAIRAIVSYTHARHYSELAGLSGAGRSQADSDPATVPGDRRRQARPE